MIVGILIPSLHSQLTDYQKALYSRRKSFFSSRGVDLVHVAADDFDTDSKTFRRFQSMEGDNLVTEDKSPTLDAVWRKMSHSRYFVTTEIAPRYPVFPSERIAEIANNKQATYLAFKKYQPETALISEYYEYENVRNRLKGETLILKPTEGYGGKGIRKITKTELEDPKTKESLLSLGLIYVLQEFKDFSKGIPGLVDGVHDFRLDHVGGKISITSIRYPKSENEFRCNMSAGGGEFCVKTKDVPAELLAMAKEISNILDPKGEELYSIDFSYSKDENRWYLIEANDSPGLLYADSEMERVHWENIVEFFKNRSK